MRTSGSTPRLSVRRRSRPLLVAMTGAFAALALSGSAQAAVEIVGPSAKRIDASCRFPYFGEQPTQLQFTATLDAPWRVSQDANPAFRTTVRAAIGGNAAVGFAIIGATEIQLDGRAATTVRAAASASTLSVPIVFPRQAIPSGGEVVLTGAGAARRFRPLEAGPTTIEFTGVTFILRAWGADGEEIFLESQPTEVPTTGQPEEFPCPITPANQDTVLLSTSVEPAPTPTPEVTPTPTPVVTPTPTPTATPTPTPEATPTLTPSPTATPSPTPIPTPVVPPSPTPFVSPTPHPDPIPTSYGLAGSATLKTLTKGSLPLSGGARVEFGPSSSSNVVGDLTLAPSTGNLTALGFLPVQATVKLVPTDRVTGTLKDGKLTAVAKVRVKLPSVKTFGIELAGGANCQAKQITSITLASTQPRFLPARGGPLAGTFDISDLSGCGFLTGIVSPLTKGTGNAIALKLTPRPLPAGF